MSLRMIEITVPGEKKKTIEDIAEKYEALDWWSSVVNDNGERTIKILCETGQQQEMMDSIQNNLGDKIEWRLILVPVETSIPVEQENQDKIKKLRNTLSREELYSQISKGAKFDSNFLMLVFLSTIVASIGLIQDNVAAVIGAMVIAPFLGPNLALAFGNILGDKELIIRSCLTNAAGLGMTLAMTILIGLIFPFEFKDSHEFMSRTDIGFAALVLAAASGAAAVLSMTTGLSAALVGVMVAVALLPPAAVLGLLLGKGEFAMAGNAGLLLLANVVCVNLTAQSVLLARGIKARTWIERKGAKQSQFLSFAIWGGTLALLSIILAFKFFME